MGLVELGLLKLAFEMIEKVIDLLMTDKDRDSAQEQLASVRQAVESKIA
jgi:predicted DNA repair protein MutK